MSAVVADSVTVQAITSLAMAPKPRLFFLTTGRFRSGSRSISQPDGQVEASRSNGATARRGRSDL